METTYCKFVSNKLIMICEDRFGRRSSLGSLGVVAQTDIPAFAACVGCAAVR